MNMQLPVACTPFTSKLPKMSQPDLDFAAPEVQSSSACSPQSDVFSFGLLILSLYNNGRSPVESSFSTNTYFRQLEMVRIFDVTCVFFLCHFLLSFSNRSL